jgi:hypothetical protein
MLAEKYRVVAYTSNARAERAGQNITSGGASDTEVNEFAVMPTSDPSSARAPTTAMPVAKVPKAWRRRCGVKASTGSLIAVSGSERE